MDKISSACSYEYGKNLSQKRSSAIRKRSKNPKAEFDKIITPHSKVSVNLNHSSRDLPTDA